MNTRLRSYLAYVLAFLLTLSESLVLNFAKSVYVYRQSVFVQAAWGGRLWLMQVVDVLGVEVDKPACETRNCILPLVAAAWGGNNDAIKFLLDRGADINDGGRFDRTPLMVASFCGETKTVKLLLDRGADVNVINNDGDTALSFARQKNQRHVIRLLLQAGARDSSEW